MLVGFDPGDLDFEEEVLEVESRHNLAIAVTGQVSDRGHRLVRLVGEPNAVLSALQDGWLMSFDEAQRAIEQ